MEQEFHENILNSQPKPTPILVSGIFKVYGFCSHSNSPFLATSSVTDFFRSAVVGDYLTTTLQWSEERIQNGR